MIYAVSFKQVRNLLATLPDDLEFLAHTTFRAMVAMANVGSPEISEPWQER